jgi:hypothetical protein
MLEQAVTCPAATYRRQHAKHAKHAKTFFMKALSHTSIKNISPMKKNIKKKHKKI